MTDATIVALVILAALALFIWNRLPAVIVGVGVSLALSPPASLRPIRRCRVSAIPQ